MLVQALISKPAVESLDVGVLVRFGWIDLPQVHIAFIRTVEHRLANELRSVVTADNPRQASPERQLIEMARQLKYTHTVIWNHSNGFVGCIVNNGQALQRSPTSGSIADKIHGPDLVQSARSTQRIPLGQISLLALTPLHLQLLKLIRPLNPLVVHALAMLTQLQVNHPNAIATMTLRKRHDQRAQLCAAIRSWLIAQHRRTHACHL